MEYEYSNDFCITVSKITNTHIIMTEQVATVEKKPEEQVPPVAPKFPRNKRTTDTTDKVDPLAAANKVIEASKKSEAAKAEAKVESGKPEVKETVKDEDEGSMSKSLMAELGYEEPAAGTEKKETTPATEKKEEVTSKVTESPEYIELKNRLAEYEDPDLQEYLKAKKAGVKVSDFRKAVTTQTLDVEKLTSEEVHDTYLKGLGLSAEDMAIEKEAFAKLLPSEKVGKIKAYRNELKESHKEGVVSEKFDEVFGPALKRESENDKVSETNRQTAIKSLGTSIDELIGKEYSFSKNNKFTIPEGDKEELMKLAHRYTPLDYDKGVRVYDAKKGLENAIKIKYFEQAQKQAADQAIKAAIKKFYRPDADGGISSPTGVGAKKETKEEQIRRVTKRS